MTLVTTGITKTWMYTVSNAAKIVYQAEPTNVTLTQCLRH